MQAIKSLVVTLCVIGLAFANPSPVFIWGVNSVAKPALSTIAQSDFAELLTPSLADKCLVVFLENDLINKDFGCLNAATEKSCYARLQGVGSKTYYPSVESPVEALRSVAADPKFYTVDESGKLDNSLELSKGNVIFIKFKGVESAARGANLESHDKIMSSFSSELGDDVFFIYTSAPSTALKRQRRDDTAATSQGFLFRDSSNLLLFYTNLTVSDGNSVTVLNVASMSVAVTNKTAMSVTLTTSTGSPLQFDITLSGGYFFMTNVVYNNIKFRSRDVYSLTDFSYFCGNLTLFGEGTISTQSTWSLKWNSLQFQAPFGSTKNESFVFGDPWHCVGFFTGGILSGLLVVALMLTITFIGVCWMMDINTMDRFDDPKGKTITISASE